MTQPRRHNTRRTAPKAAPKPPVFTPSRNGKRSSKRRRCEHCRETFTAKRSTAKYCKPACRKAAYRARQKHEKQDFPRRCAHCETGFWTDNPRRLYCKPSCRTQASRARRVVALEALCRLGMEAERAADLLDTVGLSTVQVTLANWHNALVQ